MLGHPKAFRCTLNAKLVCCGTCCLDWSTALHEHKASSSAESVYQAPATLQNSCAFSAAAATDRRTPQPPWNFPGGALRRDRSRVSKQAQRARPSSRAGPSSPRKRCNLARAGNSGSSWWVGSAASPPPPAPRPGRTNRGRRVNAFRGTAGSPSPPPSPALPRSTHRLPHARSLVALVEIG